jgi:sugar phosphate isomerase/epimerase
MKITVSSATLFWIPFERTLEMIVEAGFQNIELDLFWERKEWAMAQHLKGVSIPQAVRHIESSGLRIISIHDGGGVLESSRSTQGFINPDLDQYLDAMGYAPKCLVFHTPHVEGMVEDGWFERISDELVKCLEKYREISTLTIENMPTFEGYSVPITTTEELKVFADAYQLGVTFDTTHFAQMGVDIRQAAKALGNAIKTIHLSDYSSELRHGFIGEGESDLAGFLNAVHPEQLIAVNLESNLSTREKSDQVMSEDELVDRLRKARLRLEGYLG